MSGTSFDPCPKTIVLTVIFMMAGSVLVISQDSQPSQVEGSSLAGQTTEPPASAKDGSSPAATGTPNGNKATKEKRGSIGVGEAF